MTKPAKLEVNFWRANITKQIRIGYWRNKSGKLGSPVFVTVGSVLVKGAEFSEAEAAKAEALALAMSGKSATVEFDMGITAA